MKNDKLVSNCLTGLGKVVFKKKTLFTSSHWLCV